MKRITAWMLALSLVLAMPAFAWEAAAPEAEADPAQTEDLQEETAGDPAQENGIAADAIVHEDHSEIENALNLQNMNAEWTYAESTDSWTLSVVTAVTKPELENQQGVSVCVPGAYVKGIDTDGDGEADVMNGTAVGNLVIDYEAEVTSEYGQVYTAATAPVILNTGAAGYGSSNNSKASSSYAKQGYINVACGNRGKQDTAVDAEGNTYYTGDAPSCLVDQKNAARFVKFNILLGNLPGCVDYLISTGGSGGGAHATMFAATSNNPDFYDYEIEAGAVGVYKNADGSYDTCVNIDGEYVELSDGAWGCIAYSAITSLAEGDMTMAFEYYLDSTYDFNTSFQKQLASYLAEEYMNYINGKSLTVEEAQVGFDLNGDGVIGGIVDLSIEYDLDKYPDTNGYGGSYVDLYLAEFMENLQWYLDNLDYTSGWTWFGEDGAALSDSEVAAMTTQDKALAFLEGRYNSGSSGGSGGGPGGGESAGDSGEGESPDSESAGEREDSDGGASNGEAADSDSGANAGEAAGSDGGANAGEAADSDSGANAGEAADSDGGVNDIEAAASTDDVQTSDTERSFANSDVAVNSTGDTMDVGTPDAGTTQAAGSHTNSKNYDTYEQMVSAYREDIALIEAGDKYGNNLVDLYNPLNYIGAEDTQTPAWIRIMMGASEGDMSMFASLNLQLAFLEAGTDAIIEWQWNGGHVPSEIFGSSFALWVDTMYGEHVDGANAITKPAADVQTENGTAESANGTDLTSWVDASDLSHVTFTVAGAAAYRTRGASKAIPGFDVIDYGQEDYVFGNSETDARHWNPYLLKVFEEQADTLAPLFNAE